MKTGIVGASGYSGETLLRILSRHPNVEIALITSRSLAGSSVEKSNPWLRGRLKGLNYSNSNADDLATNHPDVSLFFLALPHGVATEFAQPLVKAGKKVIDLSADFRLYSTELYEEYYGQPHPAPELLKQSEYVIPELHDSSWKSVDLIGCPGCYPTSILVPLIPLMRSGIGQNQSIVINCLSGVSGAGKKSDIFYSYCERNESARPYGSPKHRHLSEIEEQLSRAAGEDVIVQFTPHLIPLTRGIITTITMQAVDANLAQLYNSWQQTFGDKPFISILPPGEYPDTNHIAGTNRVDISAVYDKRTNNFIITSSLDNLVKGASGQAVQIMNLWMDFEETAGLV